MRRETLTSSTIRSRKSIFSNDPVLWQHSGPLSGKCSVTKTKYSSWVLLWVRSPTQSPKSSIRPWQNLYKATYTQWQSQVRKHTWHHWHQRNSNVFNCILNRGFLKPQPREQLDRYSPSVSFCMFSEASPPPAVFPNRVSLLCTFSTALKICGC